MHRSILRLLVWCKVWVLLQRTILRLRLLVGISGRLQWRRSDRGSHRWRWRHLLRLLQCACRGQRSLPAAAHRGTHE